MGSIDGVDDVEKKNLDSTGTPTPGRPACSPLLHRLHYLRSRV
jgi:hypothetical protein